MTSESTGQGLGRDVPQTTRTRCRRGFRAHHRLHVPFRTFLAVKDFYLVRSFTPSNEL